MVISAGSSKSLLTQMGDVAIAVSPHIPGNACPHFESMGQVADEKGRTYCGLRRKRPGLAQSRRGVAP